MADSTKLCAALMLPIFAACSPAPAPEPITPEPIFDKFGGVIGCTDGGVLADGSLGELCLPPDEDDCIDVPGRPPCDPDGERPGREDTPDRDPERPDRDPNPDRPDRDPNQGRPDRDPDPDGPDRDPAVGTPGSIRN